MTTDRVPNWLRLSVGILISVACLAYVVAQVDLDRVIKALQAFDWPFLLAALASLALGYTARIVRWSRMLRAAGAQATAIRCLPAFMGSIALNNVLPLRMGDIVRAVVFPASIGVSRTTATGSLILERLMDLATLVAILLLGVAFGAAIQIPQWVEQGAFVLAVLGLGGLVFLMTFAKSLAAHFRSLLPDDRAGGSGRLQRLAADLFEAMSSMSRPTVSLQLLALSLAVWAGETCTFFFVLGGFGGNVDFAGAAVIMAIATIATLVPSSPGYVGPFHAAAFAAASMLGGQPEIAASFALLVHLTLWVPTTLAGGLAMLLNPGLFVGVRGTQPRTRPT